MPSSADIIVAPALTVTFPETVKFSFVPPSPKVKVPDVPPPTVSEAIVVVTLRTTVKPLPIVTLSVDAGTPEGVQFVPVFQVLSVEPSNTFCPIASPTKNKFTTNIVMANTLDLRNNVFIKEILFIEMIVLVRGINFLWL